MHDPFIESASNRSENHTLHVYNIMQASFALRMWYVYYKDVHACVCQKNLQQLCVARGVLHKTPRTHFFFTLQSSAKGTLFLNLKLIVS